MLRISYSNSDALHKWTLCGQLAGPWVGELRDCWTRALSLAPKMGQVMDLSDVTFVDEGGERLLRELKSAGVEFVAAGVATKDLVENLAAKDERTLRKVLGGVEGHRHWRCE
jgi:hypothetical protein